MVHFSRLCKIIIDVASKDHAHEVEFWQAATGHELSVIDGAPEYHGVALTSPRMLLFVQRLDEGTARMHLDFHTDNLEAEVLRLERAGASRVRKIYSWWVMKDPAGLLFCVIPCVPGSLNERNAQRWNL